MVKLLAWHRIDLLLELVKHQTTRYLVDFVMKATKHLVILLVNFQTNLLSAIKVSQIDRHQSQVQV